MVYRHDYSLGGGGGYELHFNSWEKKLPVIGPAFRVQSRTVFMCVWSIPDLDGRV